MAPTPSRLPKLLIRAEGLFLFAAALALYLDAGFSVLALVLLFLVPDVSIAGYLAGRRVGAIAYDAVHTEIGPLTLGAVGVIAGSDVATQVALIWLAHIGMDRTLGYGLKYPTAFADTHLQRL